MQVKLSSGDKDIIASGQALLFGDCEQLAIRIDDEAGKFHVHVVLKFTEDDSGERKIDREVVDDSLVLSCVNFSGSGTGLTVPMKIAAVNGRIVYLSFWTYLEGMGTPKARSVKYTVFYEK